VIPEFPVYLFDVDGVLIDSAPDICGAIQAVLASRGRTDVPDAFLRTYIGRHLLDLFSDLFPQAAAGEIDEMIRVYREIYPARGHRLTRTYPGVVETLARLPGLKSTATTKSTLTTRNILEQFGMLPSFHHVQGTDGFPSKPEPDVLIRSAQGLGARLEDCLFVGDSVPDMIAGRKAGLKLCAVRYGYGDPEALAHYHPEYWIDRFDQLLPVR